MIHRIFCSTTTLLGGAGAVFVIDVQKRNSERAPVGRFAGKSSGTALAMRIGTPMSSILVVTHDGDLRATAARALATAGWKVMTAAHAGHASLACAKGGPFDVLVVEDEMPDASGLALASRLRRYCPGLQVVRLCRRPSQFGDGIAVARPFFADALVDAVLRAACAIPQA